MAELYDHNDEMENAVKFFKKAQKEYPEEASVKLASLYLSNDRRKEGIKLLESIKDSKDSDIQFSIGRSYQGHDDNYAKAKLHFNKSIKLGNFDAYQALGSLYEVEGNFAKAEKAYLMGFEKSEDYSSLLSLVELYRLNGKSKDKALAHIENAKKNLDFDFQDSILYALVLIWNKELEKSVDVIKSVLNDLAPLLKDDETEEYNQEFNGVIDYLIEMISYGYYDTAYDLINKYDLEEIFKPIYFVLMNYMKELFPNEHLKMGEEIREVVEEIMTNIESKIRNRR